jgi:formate hydrogenlyase subunit 3/multisubunit Na+/H+ antiporter MnhD subunit
MTGPMLLLTVAIPLVAGVLVLAARGRLSRAGWGLALLAALGSLALAIVLFQGCQAGTIGPGGELRYTASWAGFGMEFSLRLYQFSAFILLAAAGFVALVMLYCGGFMKAHPHAAQFHAYALFSLAMVNGAALADHLITLLFFWEGLLVTLMGMIAIGRGGAWRAAIKAFVIVGVSDLCMMGGIAMTGWQAHTLTISQIHLPVAGAAAGAMVLLIIGATAKAGSMPFHSWIPDAAEQAPLPFMAILPASLEKLLGIYFLARITLDMFALNRESWVSTMLMILGSATILLAVGMALVQKDYKRLLSYHAISQVGYMVLGIGTAVPVGIVGGLFHMINHAMYKSTLFLTGGAVEKQAGTTDLAKLGGLARKMPVTFVCFVVAAASISGVPPFNGFFSKELVYDGALERGTIFYVAALLGSVLTAASFLKLGHAAYLGRRDASMDGVREAPVSMLVPMLVIAGACVVFGLFNALPLDNLIVPALAGSRLAAGDPHAVTAHHFAGWPTSMVLVALTLAALAAALVNHLVGVKISGSGLGAADHIHHAPGLAFLYDRAGRGWFDPYDLGRGLVRPISRVGWWLDRGIDAVFGKLVVGLTGTTSGLIRLVHTGSYALYIIWSLVAAAAVVFCLIRY